MWIIGWLLGIAPLVDESHPMMRWFVCFLLASLGAFWGHLGCWQLAWQLSLVGCYWLGVFGDVYRKGA